jgi:hypothetical protein
MDADENPNVISLDGMVQRKVSPFGAEKPGCRAGIRGKSTTPIVWAACIFLVDFQEEFLDVDLRCRLRPMSSCTVVRAPRSKTLLARRSTQRRARWTVCISCRHCRQLVEDLLMQTLLNKMFVWFRTAKQTVLNSAAVPTCLAFQDWPGRNHFIFLPARPSVTLCHAA